MRLVFGDPESIALLDRSEEDFAWEKLKNKVKCPCCKAKADHYFNIDLKDGWIGINFQCKDDCPNSAIFFAEHGENGGVMRCYFDLNGKEIDD